MVGAISGVTWGMWKEHVRPKWKEKSKVIEKSKPVGQMGGEFGAWSGWAAALGPIKC
jgi:hypothetical protein